MDVTVRQAAPTDVAVISGLVATATAQLWSQPPPSPESEIRAEAVGARRVVGDEFDVFVAELDGEVVGVIALTETWEVPTSAHLSSIAVRFDLWGRGVARQLLRHAVAHVRWLGYDVVECWTEADNLRAIRCTKAMAGYALKAGDGIVRGAVGYFTSNVSSEP